MQQSLSMKKKILLISGASLIIITIVLVLILLLGGTKYTIKVSLIDDKSPDRLLTVYNNKNEEIRVKRIESMDGKVLCYGYNTTVYFGDIKKERNLKIILGDNSEVIAKIVEEEVK